jgi:hypothetical protein
MEEFGTIDTEFKLLLAEKRHKEVTKLLTDLLHNINNVDNKAVITLLNSILVTTSEIPVGIKLIMESILNKLDTLKPVSKEYVFDILRNKEGYIYKVIAKQG